MIISRGSSEVDKAAQWSTKSFLDGDIQEVTLRECGTKVDIWIRNKQAPDVPILYVFDKEEWLQIASLLLFDDSLVIKEIQLDVEAQQS